MLIFMAEKWKAHLWAVLALAAIALRFFLLSDMEFKGDERHMVEYLASLGTRPFSPLTEVSYHSGIAHSSGSLYWLWLLSLGCFTPLWLGGIVATFNSAAIVWPLWLHRRNPRGLILFGFAAVSLTLVLASRKIWVPDLQVPWTLLAIACWMHAVRTGRNRWILAAGLLLPITGHMYLAGALAPGIASAAITLALVAQRCWAKLRAWLGGLALGWATFIPFGVAVLSGPKQASGRGLPSAGANSWSFELFQPLLSRLATLPSALGDFQTYLKPWLSVLQSLPSAYPWLKLLILALVVGIALSTFLFWFGLYQIARNWRAALKDALLIAALAVLPANALALQLIGIGNYLHYWFAVVPFALYILAWGLTQKNTPPILRRVAWWAAALSALTCILFALLVHEVRGLPGEYGPSFSTQPEARNGN